jgi:hypothetical protein
MRETIISKPRMSLYYHPIEKIVHHEMHQYPGLELLQEVLMRGLELLQTHGACKWLSDDRRGGVVPRSHHEWGDKVWSPQACAAGWQYWALVLPNNVLQTANMNRLLPLYTAKGVIAQIFSDPEEGFAWLRQQRKQPRSVR